MSRLHPWLLAPIVTLLPSLAAADEQCEASQALSPTRLLRRLSLDLRNHVPLPEEMAAVIEADAIGGDVIASYLESDAFRDVMREHHEELLWPNVDIVELVPPTHQLYPYPAGDGTVIYFSPVRSVFVRTVGAGALYQPCTNEPARFTDDGKVILEPVMVGDALVAYAEGYVEVEPYWAPGTTVKVCAIDALDRPTSTLCPGPADRYPFAEPTCAAISGFSRFLSEPPRRTEVACDSPFAFLAPGCGCGAGLRHCAPFEVIQEVRQSLVEQQMRMVDRVVEERRPYEDLLTSAQVDWNGPLAHYVRYQAPLSFDVYEGEPEDWTIPVLDYTDRRWLSGAGSPSHAGVLTSPGFLLRFAGNRMRAHRYYDAFECRSFVPNGPLPSPFEECSQFSDLTKRCGCDACHVTLEPLAAHWGRFTEYGFGYMSEDAFPTNVNDDESCRAPIDSPERLYQCLRLYNLNPPGPEEQAFYGALNSYVFRPPEEHRFIEEGPGARVEASIADGTIQSCVASRLWTRIMHRAPTPEESATIIPELVVTFDASGRRLDKLVEAIVTSPAYGRTR